MITWLRTADEDEAAFFALVAGEAGVPSGSCTTTGTTLTRVMTTDGQVSGFYRVRLDPGCGHALPELDYLHVRCDLRRAGLGRRLVQDAHRSVELLGHACVRVVAHPPVEAFFRAVGAHRVGTEPPCAGAAWSRPVLYLGGPAAHRAGMRPVALSPSR